MAQVRRMSASTQKPAPPQAPALDAIDGIAVLQALSDPVRLEIVRQLAGCSGSGELRCGQIELPVTKSTASHHFKTLHESGIVDEREQGTRKYMRLRRDELEQRFPGLLDSVLRATAPVG
jgi:DNA-binding transcriptional ArsR family regulator